MKKTMEELLQEQGLEQECIYDFLYPGRKGVKGNTFVDQKLITATASAKRRKDRSEEK